MNSILRNGILFGAGIIVALLVFLTATNFSTVSATQNQNSVASTSTPVANSGSNPVQSGDVQVVKLTMSGYNYILTPSQLKKGVPVRLEADLNTVTGCMRDVVISAFGVRKYVSQGDNIIQFTPDKAGTFNIACSMNMGHGQFTVLESDGSASTYAEPAKAATGGGCGCGGGGAAASASAPAAGGACHV